MGKEWYYDNASSSSHGTMICVACSKKITEGDYRYRQKSAHGDWHYQSQHKKCCVDDPAWEKKRSDEILALERVKALSRACREFKTKWGVNELDEYILEEADDGL